MTHPDYDQRRDAYEIIGYLSDWLNQADHYFDVFSPIDRYDDATIRDALNYALRHLTRPR